jgi:hypothetical protein
MVYQFDRSLLGTFCDLCHVEPSAWCSRRDDYRRCFPASLNDVAADVRTEPAMHRDAAHRIVAAVAGVVTGDVTDDPRRKQPSR